ncbi:uncharacterized protein LOC107019628 [Solanum pennellii]|uniref:Uncharacterized protein LOC107019628 n=1 Tax=Solanum pennellii TaxID=28526 RepID=A0ABM1GSZ2_SOLPN|nr:uncharacterized protein LOC107019628 [Solanum pennellii]
MKVKLDQKIKYFKFLHCWTETSGDPMWKLHQKMKKLASTLSIWSKEEFGNIFSTVADFENQVKNAEENVIQHNSEENRAKLHLINAQYIKYLKLEASILEQKAQLQWFKEGDTNSKYSHFIIRDRRRKLFIHKICIDNDVWVQGDENIAKEACDYFQNIFSGREDRINEEVLNCIPQMVNEEHNQILQQIPCLEEMTPVFFSMNPNSAPGPDGFGGKFDQACWEISRKML